MRARTFWIAIVVLSGGAALAALRSSGRFLVVDAPERSTAIVVLAGDVNDRRYRRGLELLDAGFGEHLFVDARSDQVEFGRTVAELEGDFIRRSAGRLAARVKICPMLGDSTDDETASVQRCLQGKPGDRFLLVTSEFHTRRALSIFRIRLPQYRWSAAASWDQSVFGTAWWRRREWAKTALLEWTKTVWWLAVDRWRR